MLRTRENRLMKKVEEAGLDMLIASSFENVYYTTGYASAAQKMTRDAKVFVVMRPGCPMRYVMSIAEMPAVQEKGIDLNYVSTYGDFKLAYTEGSDLTAIPIVREAANAAMADWHMALVHQIKAGISKGRVGMDFAGLDGGVVEKLRAELCGIEIIDAGPVFQEARMIKDEQEIKHLERASVIAEKATLETFRQLKPGMSEADAERIYRIEVEKAGAENKFAIFTFGQRAAFVDVLPNARQLLQEGDMIRADIGCTVEGYQADMARTAVLGKPSEKLKTYFNAIWEGEQAGIRGIKPGVSFAELFHTFVQGTCSNGHPNFRRNHVGHGIGLAVSEPPHIRPTNARILEPGMTLCVETPYYELGWGGVQVEDTLVVTESGCRVFQKDMPGLIMI